MKNLRIAKHPYGVTVRYKDDYGVAFFVLAASQAADLATALAYAATAEAPNGHGVMLIKDTTEDS